ncbi:hypothetical protein DUI87_10900 [Hirundo rustica rustica]|uniref:Reverse transcriptase domain-containing protein n=1 Tax=Hirundo rustica rustica TaxID=333673 RepID=A0A3M0KJZ0_HIRRU|nr:hypothetical protein DUI87_10900 [Hirundo rustica rustica]
MQNKFLKAARDWVRKAKDLRELELARDVNGNKKCFYWPVNLILVLGKVMEQLFLETILRHVENKEMIGGSEYGFTEGKLCLINLVAFHNMVTELVDRRGATDSIYLDLCKAFDAVLHVFLVSKLERHGFSD